MKNECGKTRPVENPYEIWQSYDGTWEWRILKKYQTPTNEHKNPYARWYCAVKSPFTFDSWEYGDTYIKDIIQHARMIKGEVDLKKTDREEIDFKNIF